MSRSAVLRRAAPALMLLVSLLLLRDSLPRVYEDLRYAATSTEVSFWSRGGYRPDTATLARTASEASALLAARPEHPDYLALAANASAGQGYYEADREVATGHLQRALAFQRASVAARPASPEGWRMVERYAVMAGREDIAAQATKRLLQLHRGRN